jgi:hypothetical protein
MKSKTPKPPRKKHPSGYAGRMARRKRLAENKKIAVQLIDMPYVGKLRTVGDWHTQIARIYRRTLTGSLPEYVATKLVYIATAGATLAKMLQELREIETLRQQLAEIRNGSLPLTNGHGRQEFLPAINSQTGEEL